MSRKREMSPKLNRTGWCFVIPSVILIILFVFYPMVQALITSFQTGAGNNLTFAGIANYKRLLTDTTFRKALFNTVLYLIVQVPIMILLALVISSMLNNKKLKFKGFFRTAIFLPCVTSLVAYSIVFKSLFATDGFVNAILMKLNLIAEPISWITDPVWAKILIILAITWRWTGYNMVFYLSGLQGIDYSIYEAADIDGAGAFEKFKSITLPMLKPIILFTTINSTIGTLLPGTYFLENLKTLLGSDLQYLTAYKNSLIIAVVTTALAMIVSSAAGYAFVVYKTKARERVFSIVLLSMMVPFAALMVPLFRLFSKFNELGPLKVIGLNTPMSVIIIAIATAFLIFFFRQNTQSFPKELIEAARIDGLSEAGIFFRVFIPTNKSCYAAAIVVTFMTSWNNYLWPLIALQSPEKRTLPLVMAAMGSSYTPDYGMMMTAVVLATIPTALIFFLMQKQFVAGMTGSVKG